MIPSCFLDFTENGLNITAYAAHHGLDDAVIRLISLGGNLTDAIYGYALAKDRIKVDAFLHILSKEQMDVGKKKAVKGYAAVGDMDSLHQIKERPHYLASELFGLALAGKKDEVTVILDANIALFPEAVRGYATGNHYLLLGSLIKGTIYYPLAIEYAACSGHKELVRHLASDKMLINHAIQGYARGRHLEELAVLLEAGGSITHCLSALNGEHNPIDRELVFALLAHIKQESTRKKLLEQLSVLATIDASLKFTSSDLKRNQVIMSSMEEWNLNYIEASRAQQEGISREVIHGPISLAYLARVANE